MSTLFQNIAFFCLGRCCFLSVTTQIVSLLQDCNAGFCSAVIKAVSLQVLAYCRHKYKANWGTPLSGYPFAMCHYRMKGSLLVTSSMLFFYFFIQKQAILYSGGSIVIPSAYSATHFVYNPSSILSHMSHSPKLHLFITAFSSLSLLNLVLLSV